MNKRMKIEKPGVGQPLLGQAKKMGTIHRVLLSCTSWPDLVGSLPEGALVGHSYSNLCHHGGAERVPGIEQTKSVELLCKGQI